MLSKRNQTQKSHLLWDYFYMILPRIGYSVETESSLAVPRECGEGRMRRDCLMDPGGFYGVLLWKSFDPRELVVLQHCKYTKYH